MIKLGEPVGVYEETQARINVEAVQHIFVGKAVPRGCILHVEEAAVTDFTIPNTVLALGKRDAAGVDHWIKQQTGANTFTCNLTAYPILKAGERPIGRVDNPNAADDLYFTIYGWLYKHLT